MSKPLAITRRSPACWTKWRRLGGCRRQRPSLDERPSLRAKCPRFFRRGAGALFSGLPSEIVQSAVPLVPDYVRASGGVRVRFGASAGRTQAIERAESGGFPVRLPPLAETREAGVLHNRGGR